MEFYRLYLSFKLLAVVLLTEGSNYWLFKLKEMFPTVTKRSKFIRNCLVNLLLTFNGNRMQGIYICSPYKFQQIQFDTISSTAENEIKSLQTNKHTNKQTPWSRVYPEKLTSPHLVKKFREFYGLQRFITVYIRP